MTVEIGEGAVDNFCGMGGIDVADIVEPCIYCSSIAVFKSVIRKYY